MASAPKNIDSLRLIANQTLDPAQKRRLGQFMTPSDVAVFMASLFNLGSVKPIRLLDAGAGIGSLTVAFLDRALQNRAVKRLDITAYEVDELMCQHLRPALAGFLPAAAAAGVELTAAVLTEDFVESACSPLFSQPQLFTHAILNPPYKKISSDSLHRAMLRRLGIETVNLYSAFVALAIDLMAPGGQIVAILPRSFCNGPYYRPFRDWMLDKTAIKHIHVFGSRTRAFRDDSVLQENVILHLERAARQGSVKVSKSTDPTFKDYTCRATAFDRIVKPGDAERFIHIPEGRHTVAHGKRSVAHFTLSDIGLEVATGPVVDFRMAPHLRDDPSAETAPLLYAAHFAGGTFVWPRRMKKPNAIVINSDTERWLYPNGFYLVVRRFSSKEERRRVVARVLRPELVPGKWIGFENHLNVYHIQRHGIPEALAYGTAAFLNSTFVDQLFRTFSGHTQVNATDLRSLPYPSAEALTTLGDWACKQGDLSQEAIDNRVSLLA